MANLILPAQTDLALALREPNLLVPGRQPSANVSLKQGALNNGLQFAVLPFGGPWRDYKQGINFETVGTVDRYPVQGGMSVDCNGNTYYRTDVLLYPPCTMLFVAVGFKSTGGTALGGSGNEAADNARIQFDIYNGKPRSIIVNTSGTAQVATSTAADITNGELYAVLFTVSTNRVPSVFFRNIKTSASALTGTTGTYTGTRIGALAKLSFIDIYQRNILFSAAWNREVSDAEAWSLLRDPYQLLKPANDTPYLISVPTGGGTYTETLDGALTTGGNLADTFTPGAVSYQESFTGLLQTGGDLAPIITYALDAAGSLQSGGDLADTFDAGAVTYTETLDGALQSGGDLIPVVGYGLALDGLIQSGGNLVDTFTAPGNYQEAFSGALTTGGDLVPVLSSSIAAIGSLDTGGDLVVFVSYAQTLDGLLQTGGDMADTFTDATGAWSEAMAGALTTGGDLVPVAQWGVLVDGVLVVGGNLADLFESGVVDEVDGLEIAREVAMTRAIYNALGQSVTYRGDATVRIKAIFDQRDELAGGFDARAVGGDAVARIQVADVASPERGDTITTRLGTVHTVDQYQRLNWAEWIVELSNNG